MIVMIGDRSEGISSLTSMIGKTVIKLVWVFLELDFFSKLKPTSTDWFPHEKQVYFKESSYKKDLS